MPGAPPLNVSRVIRAGANRSRFAIQRMSGFCRKCVGYVAWIAQNVYDGWIVPPLARYLGWTYVPLRDALLRRHWMFLANLVPGMGHNTVELDYFLRRKAVGQLPEDRRFALIRAPNAVHRDTLDLYGPHFDWASKSRWLYSLLLPLTVRFPELRLDCGLSRLKWHLRPDGSFDWPPRGQTFLYQVSKAENRSAWAGYYRLRAETENLTPLAEGIGVDPELLAFLGGRTEKLALFHMKLGIINATAAPTEPRNYLQAIRWLTEQGYQVVHVGREPMPDVYKDLGVWNYAEHPVASYRRDLQLFSIADLAVTAGSGISQIPDCMDRPLVYLDSWHLGMPMASRKCVMVPALVRDRATGRLLSFAEQFDLYLSMEDRGDEVFPLARYEGRNASPDEVMAAVKEALELSIDPTRPLTDRQHAYRSLDSGGLLGISRSRISEYFLTKHKELLDAGGLVPAMALYMTGAPEVAADAGSAANASAPLPADPNLLVKIRERGLGWFFSRSFAALVRLGARVMRAPMVWWRFMVSLLLASDGTVRNERRDTLYVFYDLNRYAYSYDVCWFLMWAELQREKAGKRHLHVLIVPADEPEARFFAQDAGPGVTFESQDWRYQNICIPALSMLPSVAGITICHSGTQATAMGLLFSAPGRTSRFRQPPDLETVFREVVEGLTQAASPPRLRAPGRSCDFVDEWLRLYARGRKAVVISLRDYEVQPLRNSWHEEWAKFISMLDEREYFPVIVPDTYRSFDVAEKYPGVAVFGECAWNMELRMALYEKAYLNMLVNSGPASLCVLNDRCRYLFFKVIVRGSPLASEEHLAKLGFELGSSPSFAGPYQKWVWEDDQAEILKREFDLMVARIEAGQPATPAAAGAEGR